MSNHLAIATVSAVLQRVVEEAAGAALHRGATVTNTRPSANGTGMDPSVNIYLYQVTPNPALRNQDLPTRGSGGEPVRPPQVALDLHYLLSFYGDDSSFEPQCLLGRVVSHLDARPVFSSAMIRAAITEAAQPDSTWPGFMAHSDLDAAAELIKLTPVALSFEELSRLWTNLFQGPHALSVAYMASVVLIDGEVAVRRALPVQDVGVHVRAGMQHPVITGVQALEGPGAPILHDSPLVVLGRGLQGTDTQVWIDGETVAVERRHADRVTLPPPDVRAGARALQVFRPWMPGDHPRVGQWSNLVTFVLQPKILDGSAYQASEKAVTFEVAPAVVKRQALTLLLIGAADASKVFRYEMPKSEGAKRVEFAVQVRDRPDGQPDAESGQYRVRILVDGVRSGWTRDAGGEIVETVTVS